MAKDEWGFFGGMMKKAIEAKKKHKKLVKQIEKDVSRVTKKKSKNNG